MGKKVKKKQQKKQKKKKARKMRQDYEKIKWIFNAALSFN